MEPLDEKKLKQVFGKLRNYEPESKGIDWKSLSPHLPKSDVIVQSAVIAVLVGLFLISISIFYFPGMNSRQTGVQLTEKNIKSPELESPPKLPQTRENKIPEKQKSPIKANHPVSFNLGLKSPTPSTLSLTPLSTLTSLPKNTEKIDLPFACCITQINSSSTDNSDPKKDHIPVTIRFSSGYIFGVVQPLIADLNEIKEYKSNPGMTLQIEVLKQIAQYHHLAIETGPGYSIILKSFEFLSFQYSAESISEEEIRFSKINQYAGWSIYLHQQSKNWFIGADFRQSLSKEGSLSKIGANRFLRTSIRKQIKIKDLGLDLGASFSWPVGRQARYFKYYPIQLSVGFQKSIKN